LVTLELNNLAISICVEVLKTGLRFPLPLQDQGSWPPGRVRGGN